MKNVPRSGGMWILYATTAAVVLSVLIAGWWPLRFHPANNADWMMVRDGIHFGAHGSVASAGEFRVPGDLAAGPCSLELWLEPDFSSASSSILAFSTPANPVQLQLIQSLDNLFVDKERADRQWRREAKHIAVISLFQKNRSVFIAISGDSDGTAVFIDGSLRRRSSEFRLTCESLTGTLVLANSPIRYTPWQGSIFALAVYRGSLDALTIRRHYRAFSAGTAPDSADLNNALALYNFSERHGQFIRNQTKTEPDLTIRESYSILYPPFLTPAWKEFAPTRWYFEDLALNVAGFLPLGFFVCAALCRLRGGKRSVALATVAGFLLSLTIEIVQAHIPMRYSGTTDLITNTLGSGFGAAFYELVFRRRVRFKTP